jgi:isochorismate hydrolase
LGIEDRTDCITEISASYTAMVEHGNFGDWRSEKEVLMGRCLEAKGAQFVRPLLPDGEDYFVLKPMHYAFYMTPLDVLLKHLKVETLIFCWANVQ